MAESQKGLQVYALGPVYFRIIPYHTMSDSEEIPYVFSCKGNPEPPR